MYIKLFFAFILSFALTSCATRNIDLSSSEQMEFVLAKVQKGEAGTYIPWQPVEFTYKNYKGSPSIDSPEFGKIVEEKFENGACRTYYTKYSKTSYEEVKRLADDEKDSEAMFEMYLRSEDSPDIEVEYNGREYLLSAARMGHLNAYLNYLGVKGARAAAGDTSFQKYVDILDVFIKTTPTAAIEMYDAFAFGETENIERSIELLKELSNAGNYGAALFRAGAGRVINLEYPNNITAVECYCEAYFGGCAINFKSQVICGTPLE